MANKKNPEDDDPILAAEMERALAPYMKLVPPEMLETFRDILRHSLTEHPVGKALLDRVKALEKRPPNRSGDTTKDGVRAEPTPEAPSTPRKPGGVK